MSRSPAPSRSPRVPSGGHSLPQREKGTSPTRCVNAVEAELGKAQPAGHGRREEFEIKDSPKRAAALGGASVVRFSQAELRRLMTHP